MRRWLSLLNFCYFPFIGFLAFLQLGGAVGCVLIATMVEWKTVAVPIVLWVLAVFLFILFGWFLVPMYHFITWEAEPEWIMDLKVSREEAPALYTLMDEIAERNQKN